MPLRRRTQGLELCALCLRRARTMMSASTIAAQTEFQHCALPDSGHDGPMAEYDEAERLLTELSGSEAATHRACFLQVRREKLRSDAASGIDLRADLPPVLQATADHLRVLAGGDDLLRKELAERALLHPCQLLGNAA